MFKSDTLLFVLFSDPLKSAALFKNCVIGRVVGNGIARANQNSISHVLIENLIEHPLTNF